MRLEKGYLHWKADLITEFDPFETGLGRFVDLAKDFVGKDALLARRAEGPRRRLVCLDIAGAFAPAHPGASVVAEGAVVGTVTSGDWGHRVGKNLAYAFVDAPHAETGAALDVEIIGGTCAATIIPFGPYDPDNIRVRS